jgi:hypothetical protein
MLRFRPPIRPAFPAAASPALFLSAISSRPICARCRFQKSTARNIRSRLHGQNRPPSRRHTGLFCPP